MKKIFKFFLFAVCAMSSVSVNAQEEQVAGKPNVFIDYFYRLVLQDGTPLTEEDAAWTVRVTHYSSIIQPVSISSIETTTTQKWSVVTQFVRTWTSVTHVS